MRDILTALAGLVILILAAALVAPPFIPWESYRAGFDAALSRSLGVEAHSDGRLEIRLLPSPRLRVDHLVLATGRDRPSLDARFVKAEIALTPLLSGEIRFTETRIGRGEVTLPMTEAGSFRLPPGLAEAVGGELAVEDLRVSQLLVTTRVAATGRTDQVYAENVRLSAPRLSGPWRAEGSVETVPFRLSTGAPGPDGTVPVKLGAGGDTVPRLDLDARLSVAADPDGGGVPEASGTARLVVGPPAQVAGAGLPFSVQGGFKAKGRHASFDSVSLEVPGEAPLRVAGRGSLDLAAARAALTLEARRLDLDAFLTSATGQALIGRGLAPASLPGTLAIEIAVDSLVLAREEWSGASLGALLRPSGAVSLRRLSGTAAGAMRLALTGDVTPSGGISGHVAVDAPASDRLARLLDHLGLGGPLSGLLDGRPFSAEADVAAALPVLSLRNARVALGGAKITGSARYSPTGPDVPRPRLDAQIVADGLDVAELPPMRGAIAALQDHDVGLTLQARDLRYGPTGTRTGEIAASLQSEGAALRLDSLEVRDLAGAQASLSGRIGADGAGRIAGRVSAPVAAPLIDLVSRTFVDEARVLPAFLRDGPVALEVTLEREPGAVEDGRLRGHARGSAAGGRLGLSVAARAGRLDSLDARLDGVASGRWLGRPDDPALASPANLRLGGRRAEASAPLSLTLDAEIAGAAIGTSRPLLLPAAGGPVQDGALTLASPDLRPLAGLLGRAAAPPDPVPARLTLGLSRSGEIPRLALAGTVAGTAIDATLTRNATGDVAGSVALERLSLPWLTGALGLNIGAASAGTESWAAARFAPPAVPPVTGQVAMTVRRLDLGRGLAADWARFGLGLGADGLSLREFEAGLAGGRLAGSATLARQGGQATLSAEGSLTAAALPTLTGGEAVRGQVSLRLRLGAAGDSPAALVGNLAGSGGLELAGLTLRDLDPAAVQRALARLLAEEDPLRAGRVERVVSEEFDRGPLVLAGPVAVPASMVGGTLRTGTLTLDLGPASWSGLVQVDMKSLRLDARGTLTATTTPRAWTAPAPTLGLALAGPLARPQRELDLVPLSNVLAAVVLQRELDKIETVEADRNELARRRSRLEMDRARTVEEARLAKQRAEEAARAAEAARATEAARAAEAARQKAEEEEASRRQGSGVPETGSP
ncbi:AsmA-like C-terminal region-containing protein [Methylobacterium nonmethylotrophicum]|uniref:Uncharacterized protein n=1 Tax=Methylobacterium nonmethylotrophicum TaxID=1141884 RepID=A0A4Z0NM18_9HYPH|nr:AsmA-like C-terminal region-containing protein [Methylobacterium nonmethylotrophicum]TGD97001.1 hypothetical protein EU555_21765 [Methylobacterium nonmethylotrophicum]